MPLNTETYSYLDINICFLQVNWMRYNHVGGIMLTSLDMDDYSGLYCTGEVYPLLHAIHHQLTAPLPPDPRQFANNRHIDSRTQPLRTPPPHTETSTIDWIESSSLLFLDYLFPNESVSFTMPATTEASITSTKSLTLEAVYTTTSATTTSDKTTIPTTTTTTNPAATTSSTATTKTRRPATSALSSATYQTNQTPAPRHRKWQRTRNNKFDKRTNFPSRRVITRNMAIDEGVQLQRDLFARPQTIRKTQVVQEKSTAPQNNFNRKETKLRSFLKESGNVPTHRLINSILMLLESGTTDQPTSLSSINTGHWNRRNPEIATVSGTIKNTQNLRSAIIEQPNLMKADTFRNAS